MIASLRRVWRRHREAYLLLALPLAIIVFFRIFTVFGAVWISVVQYGPKSAPFVGAANYVATVKDDTFW
ncbi:MAG: hypothetical protein ACYC5O_23975, partial [Anaerolineae bacterium]